MTIRTKRIYHRNQTDVIDPNLSNISNSNKNNDEQKLETVPLSPVTSPDRKPIHSHLTPRQEQNRRAQKIFREKRAQTLREMEDRLGRMERLIEVLSVQIQIRRIGEIEKEIEKLRIGLNALYGVVDSLTMPTWTVPNPDELKDVIQQIDQNSTAAAMLGALRPSSTDPTLTTTSHNSDEN